MLADFPPGVKRIINLYYVITDPQNVQPFIDINNIRLSCDLFHCTTRDYRYIDISCIVLCTLAL